MANVWLDELLINVSPALWRLDFGVAFTPDTGNFSKRHASTPQPPCPKVNDNTASMPLAWSYCALLKGNQC